MFLPTIFHFHFHTIFSKPHNFSTPGRQKWFRFLFFNAKTFLSASKLFCHWCDKFQERCWSSSRLKNEVTKTSVCFFTMKETNAVLHIVLFFNAKTFLNGSKMSCHWCTKYQENSWSLSRLKNEVTKKWWKVTFVWYKNLLSTPPIFGVGKHIFVAEMWP